MMNQAKDEKQTIMGQSVTFWVVAGIGVVSGLIGMLICGLIIGLGVFVGGYQRVQDVMTPVYEGQSIEAPEATVEDAVPEVEPEPEVIVGMIEEGALPPKVGNRAANFTLKDLNGDLVSLSDFEGQPVVINFWATWCGPCEAEMPDINDAYLRYRDEGLVVLAIDMAEHPDTVRSFVNYYDLSFAILMDQSQDIGNHYGARALPTTYFVDTSGNIAHVYFGQMRQRDILVGLRKIMPHIQIELDEESGHLIR